MAGAGAVSGTPRAFIAAAAEEFAAGVEVVPRLDTVAFVLHPAVILAEGDRPDQLVTGGLVSDRVVRGGTFHHGVGEAPQAAPMAMGRKCQGVPVSTTSPGIRVMWRLRSASR